MRGRYRLSGGGWGGGGGGGRGREGRRVWWLVFQFRRNFTVNLPTWWTFNRARFNEYPQNKHRSASMIISRCVPLYRANKKKKKDTGELTAPRSRDRIVGFMNCLTSCGQLESLSVNIPPPLGERSEGSRQNSSAYFDPAIIGGPLFLPRNWAGSVRDGSLFYLNSLEISYAFVERVFEKNFSSSLDQLQLCL